VSTSDPLAGESTPDGMTGGHDERGARARLVLGMVLKDAGEQDCAVELFHRALSFKPNLVEAHVCIGFASWLADDAAAMYEAFSVATRLDPSAVRAALLERPEEARLITLILYPKQYGAPAPSEGQESVIPVEVRDRAGRLAGAEGLVAEGRDAEAIEEIERLLDEDPEDLHPVPLLVLAHLLLRATGAEVMVTGRASALWGIEPGLAKLLFRS
jgi:tetratricopeptide (TPR) repeat protein